MNKIGLIIFVPLLFASCKGSGSSIKGHFKDNKVTYTFNSQYGKEEDFRSGVKTITKDPTTISNMIIDRLKSNGDGFTEDNCLQISNDYGIDVVLEGGGNTTFYPCNLKSKSESTGTQAPFNFGKIKDKFHLVTLKTSLGGNINIISYNFGVDLRSETRGGKQYFYRSSCGNTWVESVKDGLKIYFTYVGEYGETESDPYIIIPPEDVYSVVYSIDFVLEYTKVS